MVHLPVLVPDSPSSDKARRHRLVSDMIRQVLVGLLMLSDLLMHLRFDRRLAATRYEVRTQGMRA